MSFNKDQPIYIQLIDKIKILIINGTLIAGDKLPSIREYAQENVVNPNTVQKAFSELENQGLIYSKRGIGYFVNESDEFIEKIKDKFLNEKIDEFIQAMSELDYTKETIIKKIKEQL